jgi:hypothetical protein
VKAQQDRAYTLSRLYGTALPLRIHTEEKLLSQVRRLPALHSSQFGLGVLRNDDEKFGFEDWLSSELIDFLHPNPLFDFSHIKKMMKCRIARQFLFLRCLLFQFFPTLHEKYSHLSSTCSSPANSFLKRKLFSSSSAASSSSSSASSSAFPASCVLKYFFSSIYLYCCVTHKELLSNKNR